MIFKHYTKFKFFKIMFVVLVLLITFVLSGCLDSGELYEGDPVSIREACAHRENWDDNPSDDGYEVWFTLVNTNNEMISANGQVYYTISKYDSLTNIRIDEGFRTIPISVSSSEFANYKISMSGYKGTLLSGYKRTLLIYTGKISTELTESQHEVYVHFIKNDGTELVGKADCEI